MPGIHHVMARTIKDVFCRYKTQQDTSCTARPDGTRTDSRWSWASRRSSASRRRTFGRKISIEEYNRACREAVMEFTGMWEELTRKMGYWVNMDDPYITYDNKYIESLWWLLKQLFDKGLLYKATRSSYSPPPHGALDPRA